MAKFLTTDRAVSEIKDLIRNAEHTLTLVSPYLKLEKTFRELLNYRNNQEKKTTIIFGKQELNPDDMSFLQSLRWVSLKYYEDLHAKCYFNDDKMVITSLNLYHFSMVNNKEMGVLIDKNDPVDAQLYKDASGEVDFILSNSKPFPLDSGSKDAPTASKVVKNTQPAKPTANQTGYCIRTGVKIPFNVEKPLSFEAYKKWNEYGDPNYPEKYCHYSGEPSNGETSVSKPILKKNWSKAKEIFGL